MPSWEERNRWLEKGLEKMEEPMHWSNKVRCSRELVGNVNNTPRENKTSSTNDNDVTDGVVLPPGDEPDSKYEWTVVDGTLEEHARKLEHEGYTLQWLGEHIVKAIPPGKAKILW